MKRFTADKSTETDDCISIGLGDLHCHLWDFKGTRHPVDMYILVSNSVTGKAIHRSAQQVSRDQLVEPPDNYSESFTCPDELSCSFNCH